jgi:sigma-54 specific flagellar transcriptional regulator A
MERVMTPSAHTPVEVPSKLEPMDLAALLRDIENKFIDAALAQTGGNRQAAATLLGLQRTTLVEKLKRRFARRTEAPEAQAAP